MTKKANFYKVNVIGELKKDFTDLESLGVKTFLETIQGKAKAATTWEYSTYHSEPATISINWTIGTKNQITVQDDHSKDYHLIKQFNITTGGALLALDNEGNYIKIEIGPLTQ